MNILLQGKLDQSLKNLDDTIIQWEMIHNKALAEDQRIENKLKQAFG
jgi:hypothetical protein